MTLTLQCRCGGFKKTGTDIPTMKHEWYNHLKICPTSRGINYLTEKK